MDWQITLYQALTALGIEIVEAQEQQLLVHLPNADRQATLSLYNLRKQLPFLQPEEANKQILDFAQKALAVLQQQGRFDLSRLYPRILPSLPADQRRRAWSRSLVDDVLDVVLVRDDGSSLAQLGPLALVQSGISLAELEATAWNNLQQRSQGLALQAVEQNLYMLETGDGYDAARCMLARQWFPSQQPLWVALPARDCLWVWQPDEEAELASQRKQLARILQRTFQRLSHPISDRWFRLVDGGLVLAD